MIRFPIALRAISALFFNRLSWRSTSKQKNGQIEWHMMAPQLTIIALSLGAIVYAISQIWDEPVTGGLSQLLLNPGAYSEIDWSAEFEAGYSLDLLLIAGFWALLNVARGVIFVLKVFRTVRRTHADHRFNVPLMLEVCTEGTEEKSYEVAEISLTFMRLKSASRTFARASSNQAKLYLPGQVLDITLSANNEGRGCYNIAFGDEKSRHALERALYSVDWHRQLFHHEAEFTTPLRFISRLIGIAKASQEPAQWKPELVSTRNNSKELQYRNHAPGQKTALKTFDMPPWHLTNSSNQKEQRVSRGVTAKHT